VHINGELRCVSPKGLAFKMVVRGIDETEEGFDSIKDSQEGRFGRGVNWAADIVCM
jgi:hypothetical protein